MRTRRASAEIVCASAILAKATSSFDMPATFRTPEKRLSAYISVRVHA